MAEDKDKISNPSPKGDEGGIKRAKSGRFVKGTCGGNGNPNAKKVANYRQALLSVATEKDVKDVAKVLIEKAKEGEPWAIGMFYDRLMGKPVQSIDQNVTTTQISPEEASKRIAEFFGVEIDDDDTIDKDKGAK